MIAQFGSLGAVLAADPEARARIAPRDGEAMSLLSLVREAHLVSLREEVVAGPVLSNPTAAIAYLHALMAHERTEQVRLLHLDAKARLVRDEIVSTGSVNSVSFNAAEILRRALLTSSASLILAHNHPSGDPTPSARDVAQTKNLVELAARFDIDVFDHLVIARNGWVSMRKEGLLA